MKAKKTLGTVATSLGFVLGFAALTSATPGGSIDTTGPDSRNEIRNTSSHNLRVRNNNHLNVVNTNQQDAYSGSAKVNHNTRGGDAETGSASNANSSSMSATVNNSGSTSALMSGMGSGSGSGSQSSIENTGPDSNNIVTNRVSDTVSIQNDNNLKVDNYSSQSASTGSAVVSGNTTGGSASSGNAENRNTTSTTFHVTN